jgi:hypothetical protein
MHMSRTPLCRGTRNAGLNTLHTNRKKLPSLIQVSSHTSYSTMLCEHTGANAVCIPWLILCDTILQPTAYQVPGITIKLHHP